MKVFKIALSTLGLILALACGVKTPPIAPTPANPLLERDETTAAENASKKSTPTPTPSPKKT